MGRRTLLLVASVLVAALGVGLIRAGDGTMSGVSTLLGIVAWVFVIGTLLWIADRL